MKISTYHYLFKILASKPRMKSRNKPPVKKFHHIFYILYIKKSQYHIINKNTNLAK